MKLMHSKALWAICLFTWLSLASEEATTTHTNLRADEYVFAFDLHDVVFKTDWQARWQELKAVPYSLDLILTLLNPFFLYDVINLIITVDTYEEIIETLSNKYPTVTKYQESILALINTQAPIEGTVKIIKDLKAQGFRLYVFSNIGKASFLRLKELYPEIFALFHGYTYAEPDDNWIKKPHKEAYEKFLHAFNLQRHHVIFIDDKQINIEGAQKVGINGIHFTSATELEHTLKHYNPQEPHSAPALDAQKDTTAIKSLASKDCLATTNL